MAITASQVFNKFLGCQEKNLFSIIRGSVDAKFAFSHGTVTLMNANRVRAFGHAEESN